MAHAIQEGQKAPPQRLHPLLLGLQQRPLNGIATLAFSVANAIACPGHILEVRPSNCPMAATCPLATSDPCQAPTAWQNDNASVRLECPTVCVCVCVCVHLTVVWRVCVCVCVVCRRRSAPAVGHRISRINASLHEFHFLILASKRKCERNLRPERSYRDRGSMIE